MTRSGPAGPRKLSSEPRAAHGAIRSTTDWVIAGIVSASGPAITPRVNSEKAASRPATALGTRAGRPIAPPRCRTSTMISGTSTSGPAIASSSSTASAGSSRSVAPRSQIGIGSVGSMWMESTAA